jgi:hypothetical protein
MYSTKEVNPKRLVVENRHIIKFVLQDADTPIRFAIDLAKKL